MTQLNHEEVSLRLYEALMQMRHSRGIDIKDFDIILDAMEGCEEFYSLNPSVKMWRVTFHESDKPYWVATCSRCDVGEVKLPMADIARRWCRQHECETNGETNG